MNHIIHTLANGDFEVVYSNADLVRELNRAKVAFQMRALCTVMGIPEGEPSVSQRAGSRNGSRPQISEPPHSSITSIEGQRYHGR